MTVSLEGYIAESPPNPWLLSDQVLLNKDGTIKGFVDFSDSSHKICDLTGKHIVTISYDEIYPNGPLPLFIIYTFDISKEPQ